MPPKNAGCGQRAMDTPEHGCRVLMGTTSELGAMKAWLAACIVGAITFTGTFYLLGGFTPAASVEDALQEAVVPEEGASAETAWPALSAAVQEAFAKVETAPDAEPAAVTGTVS